MVTGVPEVTSKENSWVGGETVKLTSEDPQLPSNGEDVSNEVLGKERIKAQERKLVRKADLRLVPALCALFFMTFLDRANISNALTLGLPEELGLKGNQANVVLTVFFAPYILFEIPSNILLRRFKPSIWLPMCVFTFGIIMIGQGFVHSYGGLVAARFFLGLAEAGMFPGCFYLLSTWYKRDEAQRRFTIFFGSGTIAAAFGSLVASGIYQMDGLSGISGWRWIFILEGILTCVVGAGAYFLVPNFPDDAEWLTAEEKTYMSQRVIEDGDSLTAEKISRENLVRFFLDIKHWMGCFMYFGIIIPTNSITYFGPTIVSGYGFSRVQTQLHSVPPFAVAWVVAYLLAAASDRFKMRSPFILFCLILGFIASGILLNVTNDTPVQYFAVFLMTLSMQSCLPLVICWYTMNLKGHFERQVGTGWMLGVGTCGAFVASFSFQASDAPRYHKGYSLLLVGQCIVAASAFIYFICLWRESRNLKLQERSDEATPHASKEKAYLY